MSPAHRSRCLAPPLRYRRAVRFRSPLVLLVLAVVAACGADGVATTDAPTAATTSPVGTSPITTSPVTTTPIGDGTAPSGDTATVITVLDGDSLRVSLAGTEQEVRLLGINAPERDECFADEARTLLGGAAGGTVTLVGGATDQFGRRLAHVYAGSTDLGGWLIAQGAAIAMSEDHDLRPDYLAAEQEAALRGVGMWAPDACGPAPDPGPFVYEIEFDAPGRDDENPNGEYVVIGNEGAAADMTGWSLRDESSAHRYRFPDGFGLDTGALVLVRSGCGADSPSELFWCADGTVWNNDGDTALLLGPDGSVVSRLRYVGD